jgi:RNase P/RNase MRP subunit POP5
MVRFKNRYLFAEYLLFPFENETPKPDHIFSATPSGLASSLRLSIQNNFGLSTLAKVSQSLSVKYYNPKFRCALIRCARNSLPLVWASVNTLPGGCKDEQGRLGLWVWRVTAASGSIRGCRKGTLKKMHRNLLSKLHGLSDSTDKDIERELKNTISLIKKNLEDIGP